MLIVVYLSQTLTQSRNELMSGSIISHIDQCPDHQHVRKEEYGHLNLSEYLGLGSATKEENKTDTEKKVLLLWTSLSLSLSLLWHVNRSI
jgi:RsiW-degrading membrane proteinase PrsW (M82 family)